MWVELAWKDWMQHFDEHLKSTERKDNEDQENGRHVYVSLRMMEKTTYLPLWGRQRCYVTAQDYYQIFTDDNFEIRIATNRIVSGCERSLFCMQHTSSSSSVVWHLVVWKIIKPASLTPDRLRAKPLLYGKTIKNGVNTRSQSITFSLVFFFKAAEDSI